MFTLDHLSDTEFEQYSFDLLCAMGFKNVSWRKGTGLDASPADQGRDVECDWEVTEPGGGKSVDHWFVQAKHYKKGVPPEKLAGALTWATAERPAKLLFIVSHFLSNPAKDYIESYKRNNRPTFKILVWEKPDLERGSASKPDLIRKYKTGGELSYLAILHPAHIAFLKTLPNFSLSTLFLLLGKLEEQEREVLLYYTRLVFLNPQPDHEHQTVGELLRKKASYDTFKQQCLEASKTVPGPVIASWIVSSVLAHALILGDTTSDYQRIKETNEKFADKLAKRLDREPQNRASLEKLIAMHKSKAQSAEKDTEKSHALYRAFCEKVLDSLVTGEMVEQKQLIEAKFYGGPYDSVSVNHKDVNLYTEFMPVGIRKFVAMPPIEEWDAVRRGDKDKSGPFDEGTRPIYELVRTADGMEGRFDSDGSVFAEALKEHREGRQPVPHVEFTGQYFECWRDNLKSLPDEDHFKVVDEKGRDWFCRPVTKQVADAGGSAGALSRISGKGQYVVQFCNDQDELSAKLADVTD